MTEFQKRLKSCKAESIREQAIEVVLSKEALDFIKRFDEVLAEGKEVDVSNVVFR